MELYSFDDQGTIRHDPLTGTSYRLPPHQPVVKPVRVELEQPDPTESATEAERMLLHAIARGAAVILDVASADVDNPPTT